MEVLGLPLTQDYQEAPRRNDKLNRPAMDFLMKFPDERRISLDYRVLQKALEAWSQDRPDAREHQSLYPPQERLAIAQEYAPSNARIAERYLLEGEALFQSPLPDPNEPWSDYPGLTADQAVDIAHSVWLAQIKQEKKLRAALELSKRDDADAPAKM
jgi:hypothetical protein